MNEGNGFDEAILQKETYSFAKRHGVLLIELHDDDAKIVYRKNASPEAVVELRRHLRVPCHLEQVDDDAFNELLTKMYESQSGIAMQVAEDIGEELGLSDLLRDLPKAADLLDSEDDAPVIKLLNAMFTEAIKLSASDLHIETFEEKLLVRVRIDGVLRNLLELPRVLSSLVISRVKVMAKLDIAEKRLPQDGRITLKIANRAVDVRVSTIPTSHGERVVMRLLDKKSQRIRLVDLGMDEANLQAMSELISLPHGILLVTGPTGSGKTTTLYAVLTELNQPTRNILTVEDPIEYDLVGVGQTQVNSKIDMTFAKGLRAILRQDPDIVMVGEIRDLETASIAVQASLTGHLVLSTLHTNTAIGAITRLRDMGVESFLLSSAIIGIVAQRLVRLLCPACKEAYTASSKECEILQLDESNAPTLYKPSGCENCNDSGYIGRTGIYEVIKIDDELRSLIHEDMSEQEMLNVARKHTKSIRINGFERVLSGETSLNEVIRVTSG